MRTMAIVVDGVVVVARRLKIHRANIVERKISILEQREKNKNRRSTINFPWWSEWARACHMVDACVSSSVSECRVFDRTLKWVKNRNRKFGVKGWFNYDIFIVAQNVWERTRLCQRLTQLSRIQIPDYQVHESACVRVSVCHIGGAFQSKCDEKSWAIEIQQNYRMNLRNRRNTRYLRLYLCATLHVGKKTSAQRLRRLRVRGRLCESNKFIGWGKNNKHHQTPANTIHGISFSPFSIHTFVFP